MRLCVVALLLAAFSSTEAQTVTLRGTATDCFAGQAIKSPEVRIAAFDAARSKEMLKTLRAMDESGIYVEGDTNYMRRLGRQYDRVTQLTKSSRALARVISDAEGLFTLRIAPTDSVLIFGYEETEDEPFYYSYTVVAGRASRSVNLDMTRGGCGTSARQKTTK